MSVSGLGREKRSSGLERSASSISRFLSRASSRAFVRFSSAFFDRASNPTSSLPLARSIASDASDTRIIFVSCGPAGKACVRWKAAYLGKAVEVIDGRRSVERVNHPPNGGGGLFSTLAVIPPRRRRWLVAVAVPRPLTREPFRSTEHPKAPGRRRRAPSCSSGLRLVAACRSCRGSYLRAGHQTFNDKLQRSPPCRRVAVEEYGVSAEDNVKTVEPRRSRGTTPNHRLVLDRGRFSPLQSCILNDKVAVLSDFVAEAKFLCVFLWPLSCGNISGHWLMRPKQRRFITFSGVRLFQRRQCDGACAPTLLALLPQLPTTLRRDQRRVLVDKAGRYSRGVFPPHAHVSRG